MKSGRSLLLALAVSVALHALAITGPGWHLPGDEEAAPSAPIDAQLVAAPAKARAEPAPTAQRRRQPAPAPRPVAPVAAEPAAEAPAATETTAEPIEQAAAELPVEVPHAPVVADSPLPRAFKLRYRISLGDSGFVIGQAVQEFRRDGRGYVMRNTMETTGIARLFKTIRMVYLSEGEVDGTGLRPLSFAIERDGTVTERAQFDWQAMEALLSPSGRRLPLEAGAQDMLSMFCQLALTPAGESRPAVPVVTRKRVERYEFALVGTEEVDTGQGRLVARHLHYRDPDGTGTTDVWLAPAVAHLPVRIHLVDQKGDAYDQTAESIEVSPGEAH